MGRREERVEEGGREEERKNEGEVEEETRREANEGQLVLVLNYSWPLRVFF